ncbi:MAG: hypothetical protein ACPGU1_19495 [Myxococcota bacterium]
MFDRTPPDHIDTIELVAHRRHARIALLTTVVPSSVMLVLYLGTGSSFFLFPIALFAAVGALNDSLTGCAQSPERCASAQTGYARRPARASSVSTTGLTSTA